jgi:hypothetical protein
VKNSGTIAIDFDGVVHQYITPWAGETVIPDLPVFGAAAAISAIRRDGYKVVIFSTRARHRAGADAIDAWLLKHEINVDGVTAEKPPAHLYVDDRALRFTGRWEEVLRVVTDYSLMRPWNRAPIVVPPAPSLWACIKEVFNV